MLPNAQQLYTDQNAPYGKYQDDTSGKYWDKNVDINGNGSNVLVKNENTRGGQKHSRTVATGYERFHNTRGKMK